MGLYRRSSLIIINIFNNRRGRVSSFDWFRVIFLDASPLGVNSFGYGNPKILINCFRRGLGIFIPLGKPTVKTSKRFMKYSSRTRFFTRFRYKLLELHKKYFANVQQKTESQQQSSGRENLPRERNSFGSYKRIKKSRTRGERQEITNLKPHCIWRERHKTVDRLRRSPMKQPALTRPSNPR